MLLDAAREAWRSPAYDHYIPSLERHFDYQGEPERLVIRFNCKFHSPHHFPPLRDRARNCDGTRNLLVSARACDAARGVSVSLSSDDEVPSYSVARHRAILAIRCARDRRSFESVVDDLHQQEVQLLRPGTELPCSATVSNDVRHIYEDASVTAARFLQVRVLVLSFLR